MWLTSARTALGLAGALLAAVLASVLTDAPPGVLAAAALGGWLVTQVVLGPAADRLDASLHRMGGPRRRGRNRG